MVQKVRKKGYFVKRRRLRIILLLIVVALCILISAFIFKLVYNQQTKTSKSSQTPTTETCSNNEKENKKYQNYANDFESVPENINRLLFGHATKMRDVLGVVLNRKLILNNCVLELDSPVDGYTQAQTEFMFSRGKMTILNLETPLNLWNSMKVLDIGDVKSLTKPEPVSHNIMVETILIFELRIYKFRSILLKGLYMKLKTLYEDDAKNMVLFFHILTFTRSLEIKLVSINLDKRIEKDYFDSWQNETGNKLALVFLNKFPNIVLGLPLFMIFHFITEPKIREMIKNGELSGGQYKPLLERLLNTDTFTKEQIDVIKGKFYKLFSLLETPILQGYAIEDEPDNIEAIYELLQLLDDGLKNFLVIYKKI